MTIREKKPVSKKSSFSKKEQNENRYIEAVGRRKTSVARVRIFEKTKVDSKEKTAGFIVNDRSLEKYFPSDSYIKEAIAPLEKLNLLDKFLVTVKIKGGGISSQAGAICHGLARSLVKFDENLKKKLRAFGFLTRDARMVERKKYGLKKARRAPQWSKR